MHKVTYVIDGASFKDSREFAQHFSEVVLSGYTLNEELSLDAFNDVLSGGFGTPAEGFVLVWRNAALSRKLLGYPESISYFERKLANCHPANKRLVGKEVRAAQAGLGPTLFDLIVEIIRKHGPGGSEEEDGVELVLEE